MLVLVGVGVRVYQCAHSMGKERETTAQKGCLECVYERVRAGVCVEQMRREYQSKL